MANQVRVIGQGRVAGTGEHGLQGREDGWDIGREVRLLSPSGQGRGCLSVLVGGEGLGDQGIQLSQGALALSTSAAVGQVGLQGALASSGSG
jgi:hypothetical protein